ncbi:MAG: hypothetical protein WCK98_04395 [bacterium]
MNVLIIILPILVAGIVRVLTDKFDIFKLPLDFGTNIWGRNKTWQGLIIISFISFVVGLLFQTQLPFYYGFILGLAYTFGEIVNSTIKRLFGVEPGKNFGKPWVFWQYIFDQIDSTLAISVVLFYWNFNFAEIFYCFVIGSFLHFFVDSINHLYGSKKTSDKTAIIYFYQVVSYVIFTPLKFFSNSNTTTIKNTENIILTSNHPFFFDSLFVLRSLNLESFLNFAPFKFLIAEKYMQNWYGKVFELVGAVSTRENKSHSPRPLEVLLSNQVQGYNSLICYEGKITLDKLPTDKLKTGIWVLYKAEPKSLVHCARVNLGAKIGIDFKSPIGFSQEYAINSKHFLKEINDRIYSA